MRLRRLEPVLRRALRGSCRLPAGARVLVAVSGGADSVALLVALRSVAREFGLSVAAAHLDHGLRGEASAGDRAFVRTLCQRLDVPLVDARWDTRARMARRGLSGEAGLRTLRRAFLERARGTAGADAIATAHTADDQLETVLGRLARGAGLTGLAGMRPRHGRWLKPLLEATRHDVERDLRRAGLAWREDASNALRTHTRNRLRHGVVPALLDALGAPDGPAVARRAALSRRVAETARELSSARRAIARAAHMRLAASWDGRSLRRRDLARGPSVVRRRLLTTLWHRVQPGGDGLGRPQLAALERLLTGPRAGGRLALPGGWTAACDATRFALVRESVRASRRTPRSAAATRPKVVGDARLRRATGGSPRRRPTTPRPGTGRPGGTRTATSTSPASDGERG